MENKEKDKEERKAVEDIDRHALAQKSGVDLSEDDLKAARDDIKRLEDEARQSER